MEDLLNIKVSGASKFLQDVREAPASITVITAEDIRRYGHRTLADVLRSVRGIYTSYDRNYTYLGVRGMARPGDYNTRVLLLVDGHRLNDGIYDMAPVGTDFPIDLSLVDRVEVIRGPASSLYGTSAFFGVINVVTRTGNPRRGVQVEVDGGSLGTSRVAASYDRLFAGGRELVLNATVYRSNGQSELFYSEFAGTPEQGWARDLDDDRTVSLFASYSIGRVSMRGAFGDRSKDIPTASYGMAFGDARSNTWDRRAYADVVYEGSFGGEWSGVARVAYDHYTYTGHYPTPYTEDAVVVFDDGSEGRVASGEVTVRRRLGRRHLLTAGIESRFQLRNRQWNEDILYGPQLDVNQPVTTVAGYVEDEVRPASWLIAAGGVRIDKLAGYGSRVSPRVSMVFLPRSDMSVKLLHGRAFRAPNAYELYYWTAQGERAPLDVERMSSSELVWEQTFKQRMRATVSAFRYAIDGLISQQTDPTLESVPYFANGDGMRGRGVEVEVESRLASGLVARASHTFVKVDDSVTGERVSNSPQNLSKIGVQVPAGPVVVALEGAYVGSRLTLSGDRLNGFFAPNITLTTDARKRLSIVIGVYNAFDRQYADPGAEEHTQQSILQDGRTALARVRFAF